MEGKCVSDWLNVCLFQACLKHASSMLEAGLLRDHTNTGHIVHSTYNVHTWYIHWNKQTWYSVQTSEYYYQHFLIDFLAGCTAILAAGEKDGLTRPPTQCLGEINKIFSLDNIKEILFIRVQGVGNYKLHIFPCYDSF